MGRTFLSAHACPTRRFAGVPPSGGKAGKMPAIRIAAILAANGVRAINKRHGLRIGTLCVLAMLLAGCNRQGGVFLEEIGWAFTLPDAFEPVPAEVLPDGSVLHRFKHEGIADDSGIVVHPNIAFIIMDVPPDTDPVLFSASRRRFDIIKMYTPADILFDVNAIGYLAEHTDTFDGREYKHRIYVLHAVQDSKGIEVVLDSTESVFNKVNGDFMEVLKSINPGLKSRNKP